MVSTMSGRVTLRISLQPSCCWKSSRVGLTSCSMVPIAPSAITTRSFRVAISASERAGRTADDRSTDGCDAVSARSVDTGSAYSPPTDAAGRRGASDNGRMPTPRGPFLPILIAAAAGAVAVGVAAIVERVAGARDTTPALPGTPQLDGRLPVGLWPADGSEPVVESGIRGWRRMAGHLYHRDTGHRRCSSGASDRARGVHPPCCRCAPGGRASRSPCCRAAIAAEVIAAAWLAPLAPGAAGAAQRRAFREFGLGD